MTKRIKRCLFGLCIPLGVLLVLLSILHGTSKPLRCSVYKMSCNVITEELVRLQESVTRTTKAILRAKEHVRGMKTRHYLDEAESNIQQALDILQIDQDDLKLRPLKPPQNVCPEEYKGSLYGYPLFYKGFQTTNCSYVKPIRKLVTVLLLYDTKLDDMAKILSGLYDVYGNIKVLIGTWDNRVNELKRHIEGMHSNLSVSIKSFLNPSSGKIWNSFVNFFLNPSPGKVWNSLIKEVNTPYIFIGRDLTHFTNDSRFERLIRVIEELDVDVAAGASRDPLGQWKQSCYQSALKNYSLVYMEGYDVSEKECLYCDYTDSPFMIRAKAAETLLFDENIPDSGLFEDFFLRFHQQKYESLVCPDSLFFVNSTRANYVESWKIFAETWTIYSLDFQPNIKLEFPCISYTCGNNFFFPKIKGYAQCPCCLRELANLLKFILNYCETNNIFCELVDGTLLGAVKFGKILPWEVDGDIAFLTANFTALKGIQREANDAGYSLSVDGPRALRISSRHWKAELWGQSIMDSQLLRMENVNPTNIFLDGYLARAPRNPGLHARNRYGHGIYAHAPHWTDLRQKDSWINYETRRFIPCRQKGRHECLDAYNGDGSMQFGHPIP